MNSKSAPKNPNRLVLSIVFCCTVALALIIFRILRSDSTRFVFMIWNLFLAITPLLFSWWLVERLKSHPWLAPKQILISLGWLLFLPNSFYLVTDFIHLRPTFEASLVFDTVLFASFALCGLILGFTSLFMVHNQIKKRLNPTRTSLIIGLILLACSFAIYLGRFTRWNSWDVLLKPAGLLFDVSDRVVNPIAHYETYETTFIFFLLLASTYWVIWEVASYLKTAQN